MRGWTELALAAVERIIRNFSRHGRSTFFDTAHFQWVDAVEQRWPAIRQELDALLEHRDAIPNFQDISELQRPLTNDDRWKTFIFLGWGHTAEENCARCPSTAETLRLIPGIKSAMFSILAPGKHLPPHRGPYSGVLRYHLGLLVPQPETACRIRVGSDIRSWEEGRSLVFDDSHEHEVWNDSDSDRVILFVDFIRPLWFPLSLINRLLIARIGEMAFVHEAIERVRQPSKKQPG